VNTLDLFKLGDEAGKKKVTLLIKEPMAMVYLKAEKKVSSSSSYLTIRFSQEEDYFFFCLLMYPELEGDMEIIEINSDAFESSTYRASGAWRQHINKTDSLPFGLHNIPTGIVS